MSIKLTDEEFELAFGEYGAQAVANHLDIGVRAVYRRRAKLEDKNMTTIARETRGSPARITIDHPEDGHVLIGSDGHYWPGRASTAHRAFVQFAANYDPHTIIMNGDAVDASCISRFPPIGWENMPTMKEELDVVQERLGEIHDAAYNARFFTEFIWTLGNHDARFETRLATVAPEFKDIHGVHLKDHFPQWTPCWSVFIGDALVIKHRFKGGIHAPHNNVIWAGRSMITGHLHSQKVTPFTDYNGTRYGVDTGCLADPSGPQFVDYTEDNPKNWRQGFCMLTFKDGQLLPPELITVCEWDQNAVTFRGEIIGV